MHPAPAEPAPDPAATAAAAVNPLTGDELQGFLEPPVAGA